MKIVIWGDLHGSDCWKKIVEQNPDADKFISMGDEFDSCFPTIPIKEEIKNFNDLINFKRGNPDKVILLVGNHLAHYTSTFLDEKEKYSRFQKNRYYDIPNTVNRNLPYFQMAWKYNEFLFTHAGVTDTWIRSSSDDEIVEPIDEYINHIWKYNPKRFMFTGIEPSGDDKEQSPIWVRPQSLMSDPYKDYKQVVGHTVVGRINPNGIDGKFFFIDCLRTSGEYLIINDNEVLVGKI